MKPFWKIFLVLCLLGGGGGYYWWKNHGGQSAEGGGEKSAKAEGKKGRRGGGGPVSVTVVSATRQPMPVVIQAVGSVESDHSVAVRPQVNGVLEAVLFKEGDRVAAGQPLFRIDARPMRAAVEQARAAVARDEANLSQAKAQEARLRPLMEKEYITRQEYDVASTQAKALGATVEANKAALEQAQLQLSYAEIKSPIAGRTGSLSVKAGNLVTGGTAGAPLVVINATQPVMVSLAIPQRYLDDVRRYWGTPDLKVEVSANPGGPAVAEGQLVFIDNTVNPQSGTILLKARVKNEKEQLWPGQFVAGRIILKVEKDALVLPEKAVQPGQEGPFVFVVKDGKAVIQAVKVDRQLGDRLVISEGLSGEEQIVGDVPPTLTGGASVNIRKPGEGGEGGKGAKGKGKGKDKSGDAPEGGAEKSGKSENSAEKQATGKE